MRTLGEALVFWFREWRDWQQGHERGQPLRLTLVVPVVFPTGADPWEGPLAFAELFDVAQLPPGSLSRIPVWKPALFDRPTRTAEALLGDPGPWHRSLAVVRQIREGTESFAECYQQALRSLIPLRAADHGRWMDFMYVLVSYALQRRPDRERQGLFDQGLNLFHDTETRQEVSTMSAKVKDFWVERDEKLIERGEQRGELRGIQETLLDVARQKLGPPAPEFEAVIRGKTDKQQLRRLHLRLFEVNTWPDLFAVPAPADSPP